MPLTSPTLRILLVARDDERTRVIRDLLTASTSPRFEVDHAANGWEAQRRAADGTYAALVLESNLGDTDSETLLIRLKAISVGAPALVLTPAVWDGAAAQADDYLSVVEGLRGNTLVRAILAMVQRDRLNRELEDARALLARTDTLWAQLTHDLATPLSVVLGMTQVLLAEGTSGLSADDRACLEDVAEAAARACELLERSMGIEPPAGAPPTVAGAPAMQPGRPASSGSRSSMVLIADDDPATRRLVSITLASDLCTVLQAADGKEAWRLIREHHPAVAILDWQMPFYTGLELTDVIKGDPQVKGMTVIMLTGRSAQADREAGALAHADLYLIKPFSPQELLGAVEQALSVAS